MEDLTGHQVVPPGRAGRPDAVSSVAPIALAIGAPCVLASEHPAHPGDERRPAKPSSPERDPVELAARALQHRDRSRRELDERLARAGVSDDQRADALATLERVGYVADARFAAARAEALAGRGYGDEAIRHDLESHGIGAEGVAEAIGGLEPELERARGLVERLGRSAKTALQLARKGFDEESLTAAIDADVAQGDA